MRKGHAIIADLLTIFVLNGPNLNLLGSREPEIYGSDTLSDIEKRCRAHVGQPNDQQGDKPGLAIEFRQSNHEGVLVDWVQEAGEKADGLILNAAAYTHTSIALLDALKAITIPVIELHLSNPSAREPFRHHSYVGMGADGVVCGFGADGYLIALDGVRRLIEKRGKQ
ncbi:MAG: type II 3-dehydroquinate dehydratase [Pseudomonadota bacterium]